MGKKPQIQLFTLHNITLNKLLKVCRRKNIPKNASGKHANLVAWNFFPSCAVSQKRGRAPNKLSEMFMLLPKAGDKGTEV